MIDVGDFQSTNDTSSNVEEVSSEENKCKDFLGSFKNYFTSGKFDSDISRNAKKFNLPKKKVANSFITKVLGTISDCTNGLISIIDFSVNVIIDVINYILKFATNLIVKVAKGLNQLVTLGYTTRKN